MKTEGLYGHLAMALLMLLIGFGGPMVDIWFGDDPQSEDCELASAPSLWIEPGHRMPCEAWGMCND
jgi:hypothetical protein